MHAEAVNEETKKKEKEKDKDSPPPSRTEPIDLEEQLALEEAKGSQGNEIMNAHPEGTKT